MSLQAHALAICATGALIEALPAWVHVAMEPHEPIELAEQLGRVVVAVFVGDEHTDIKARRWTQGVATVELVVQVLLPPTVKATIGGVECEFDTRSGGTRPLYALVHEAMRWAFTAPKPGGWGELLQGVFTHHPEPVTGMPGKAERPKKPPVPVIDYAIPCGVIMPPQLGAPAPYPWPDIVAAMRGDDAFTPEEADFFEALLAGAPLTEGRAELALAGLSRREGVALGLGPLQGVDPASILVETDLDGPNGPTVTTAESDGP